MADIQNTLDFSDIYKPAQTGPTQAAPTGNTLDFSDIYKQPTAPKTNTYPGFPSAPSGPGGGMDFSDIYGAPRIEAQHDESDRFSQDDPGANWLEKSWSFAN